MKYLIQSGGLFIGPHPLYKGKAGWTFDLNEAFRYSSVEEATKEQGSLKFPIQGKVVTEDEAQVWAIMRS